MFFPRANACHDKVRVRGIAFDVGIHTAIGIYKNGSVSILEVEVFLSESAVFRKIFILRLLEQRPAEVEYFSSEDRYRLMVARWAVFLNAKQLRYLFQLFKIANA